MIKDLETGSLCQTIWVDPHTHKDPYKREAGEPVRENLAVEADAGVMPL